MSNVSSEAAPAVAANHAVTVVWLLRLEGLAVVVLTAIVYRHIGASWWLFAALWLIPDLSMLGYLVGPRWGARSYNAVHTYLAPLTLAAAALWLHWSAALPVALIWLNHIGVDRLCGYGLKYPEGFGFTHLKRPRKRPAGE
jgi:hypothetical protein